MSSGKQPGYEPGSGDRASSTARLIGRDLRHVACTNSTMDDVAALARSGAGEGLVLSARRQSAGRGRHQRTWESSPGEDLLFSILFRPRPAVAGEINMLLSLATAELVDEECECQTRLKWPNDVRVHDAKIAGILLESTQGPDGLVVVAGVGLNVNSKMRGRNPGGTAAVSMQDIADRVFDPERLLDTLLGRVDDLYRDVRAGGTVVPLWRKRLETIGKKVEVTFTSASAGQKVISGTAEAVDETGRLIVRDENGRVWPVSAGEVTLQSAAT